MASPNKKGSAQIKRSFMMTEDASQATIEQKQTQELYHQSKRQKIEHHPQQLLFASEIQDNLKNSIQLPQFLLPQYQPEERQDIHENLMETSQRRCRRQERRNYSLTQDDRLLEDTLKGSKPPIKQKAKRGKSSGHKTNRKGGISEQNKRGKGNKNKFDFQQNGPQHVQLMNCEQFFQNMHEVIAHMDADKPAQTSEQVFLGNDQQIESVLDLKFPEQPKTKVILADMEDNEQEKEDVLGSKSYINCDLRFFNLQYLVDEIGQFEVVQIDPPWRIKGAQRNNTSFMFSNNKFNLDYSTMSNPEIMNIPVEVLSKKGFCFLWILNSQMNIGYECMNKWGYDVIDHLTWIKTKNKKIHISHGFYFLHSSETCLVGYKCPPQEAVDFRSKISNNLLVAEIRKKSQKPEQIYTLIDLMIPNARKIELFARNNNLRKGWLSLGNQLGENYVQWKNVVKCDDCSLDIMPKSKRFKSKEIANKDLCENCWAREKSEAFFCIENEADEDILHEYIKCNICNIEPIWGLRFQCTFCPDVDICETCFDDRLLKLNMIEKDEELKGELVRTDHIVCQKHSFACIEIPSLADGLAAHNQYKCVFCFARPIIGGCFICADCNHFTLCQNCYFTRPFTTLNVRGHSDKHKIELIVEPREATKIFVKCNGCSQNPIQGFRFKCENCFDFDFCEACYNSYVIEKKELKTYIPPVIKAITTSQSCNCRQHPLESRKQG